MKKILVATDFSACAGNSMDYAMGLAKTLNVEVCALHAVGSLEGVNNSTYNAIYIKDYHNSKREALTAWAKTYTSKPGFEQVQVSTNCEIGSLSTVITKYIETNKVELLVMGTMGSTGILGLFGSNASTMVEKTKIPTLIVPLESRYTTNPVITLATDFTLTLSPEDVTALNEVALGSGTKHINVLNIIEGPEWKTNEAGEQQLRKLLTEVELDFNYISESSPIEGILNYVTGHNTDILCLVKRHHNIIYRVFTKNTVNYVMNKSIKAVLVLHE